MRENWVNRIRIIQTLDILCNFSIKIQNQVCVSDGATIVYTNKGDVMALYGYTTKKLGIRQYDVKKIQVFHP